MPVVTSITFKDVELPALFYCSGRGGGSLKSGDANKITTINLYMNWYRSPQVTSKNTQFSTKYTDGNSISKQGMILLTVGVFIYHLFVTLRECFSRLSDRLTVKQL